MATTFLPIRELLVVFTALSFKLCLVICLSLEVHLANFVVIRTHLSRHFHRAVNYPGLRRNESSPKIIDQFQDFLE